MNFSHFHVNHTTITATCNKEKITVGMICANSTDIVSISLESRLLRRIKDNPQSLVTLKEALKEHFQKDIEVIIQ